MTPIPDSESADGQIPVNAAQPPTDGGNNPLNPPLAPAPASPAQVLRPHTAVVHFHGMGSQRRPKRPAESSTSSIALRTRRTSERSRRVKRQTRGVSDSGPSHAMSSLRASRREPRLISFVPPTMRRRPTRLPTDESTPPRVHFYEGYWVPITGEGVPAKEVFFWLLKRLKNPISVLKSSWRSVRDGYVGPRSPVLATDVG